MARDLGPPIAHRYLLRLPRSCMCDARTRSWNICARWRWQELGRAAASVCACARELQVRVTVHLDKEEGYVRCCSLRSSGYWVAADRSARRERFDSFTSGRCGRDASGWELSLERGVCAETLTHTVPCMNQPRNPSRSHSVSRFSST